MVVVSFAVTILLGAFLLALPASTRGEALHPLDALFTAVSAVCVTGLSVIDIGSRLSFFGQCVLLVLIQAGGLGIMTFSVFFMILFRQHISFASQSSVNFQPHHSEFRNFFQVLLFVLLATFTFEALGAGMLFVRFRELYSPRFAFFSSVFHSVSAFCNAGFSLYRESLFRFQKETYVPVVFMVLIVAGGLGFMILDELRVALGARLRGKPVRLSLHARICLSGSFFLIVSGAGMIWLLEKGNLMSGLTPGQQAINSFFLSITSRTAGFNMLETPSLTNATLYFVIWLMFIGACPGSTGGGIKVPTFLTLAALLRNQLGGRSTSLFRRKIPLKTVVRSLLVFASSFLLVVVAVLIFEMSEETGVSHLNSRGSFLDILFEVTSAFGTVGLSTGITDTLTSPGKMMTILIMFFGRIGPLTLGLAFLTRRRRPVFEYVEEDISIG